MIITRAASIGALVAAKENMVGVVTHRHTPLRFAKKRLRDADAATHNHLHPAVFSKNMVQTTQRL
jgi:hypothetical protein